ncbi:membrane-bound lytic murein transglycosylase [Ameyamaea chiangmaiensis NBRC 103196]|nr:membrane-bound lytic murein transglycosylase [Ameyamaea chiangmaiensis NBRC 103196]
MAGVCALGACSVVPPGGVAFRPTTYDSLPGWSGEPHASLLPMFLDECRTLGARPPESALGGASDTLPAGAHVADWLPACAQARSVPTGDEAAARAFFEQAFTPYVVAGDSGETATYTGYFEPEIRGATTQGGLFQTPLYGPPRDLVRAKATNGQTLSGHWVNGAFQPYDTRAQIDAGSLAGRAPVLLWLADPVDLFFLQIQGAGRVRLPDGTVRRVGYAARNGQAYVPIGRLLVEQGALSADQVSMSSIRAWLAAHPDQAQALMERNPNYVFFRILDETSDARGAPGALGIALTPGRSVAVDKTYLPLAAPVWVETQITLPSGQAGQWSHLAFAQDLGSGINGPTRADLYLGWGETAEHEAGGLHAGGRLVVLLPRADHGAASDAPS